MAKPTSSKNSLSMSLVFVSILILLSMVVGSTALQCPTHCVCKPLTIGWKEGSTMICLRPDTLDSIPQVADDAHTVLEITIRDQPRLTHLSATDLRSYTGLYILEVEYSGLKYIADDAFSSTPIIRKLHFRNNTLNWLPKRPFILMNYNEIWLDGNPLECNCSNLWLAHGEYSQSLGPQAICRVMTNGLQTPMSNTTGSLNLLGNGTSHRLLDLGYQYEHCAVPSITLQPSEIEVRMDDNITVTCRSTTPGPARIEWLGIEGLDSKFFVTHGNEKESVWSTLDIREVILSDHYKVLTCLATNIQGTTRADVRIHIFHPPRIVSKNIVFGGDRYQAKIVVSGWPKPTVTWYVDGKTSLPNYGSIKDSMKEATEVGFWRVYRVVMTVSKYNLPNYKIEVNNTEGSTSNFSMRVEAGLDIWPPNRPILNKVGQNTSGDNTGGVRGSGTNVTKQLDESDGMGDLIIFVVPSVVGFILVATVLLIATLRVRNRKRKSRLMGRFDLKAPFAYRKQDEFREFEPLTGVPMVENPNYEIRPKKFDKLKSPNFRHIQLETILLIQQIGEGAFGHVLLGKCAHLLEKNEFTNVAVKTLKGDSEEAIKRDFEKEAELLATLSHPNIVTFYGVCTEGDQWMMLFEFMENGDLNNFLRSHGPHSAMLRLEVLQEPRPQLTATQLLNIVIQISKGMDYLASQHFVHRDLATRNCLVGKNHIVKIGDFGMSKDIYSTDYYKVGDAAMLPVRWMPPESIMYRTFTVKSDVWSFGVTLWEVFTYGTQPWFEYSNMEVIDKIKTSSHLSRPSVCPDGLYAVMEGCWVENPADRLTMKEINRLLQLEMERIQPSYIAVLE